MTLRVFRKTPSAPGFSLLELLLVVAIGGVLLVAALTTYRMVMVEHAVSETIRAIMSTKHQVSMIYRNASGGYGFDSLVPYILEGGGFPGSIRVDESVSPPVIYHPLGERMDVFGFGDHYEIQILNIRASACIRLGSFFDVDQDLDFRHLIVDSNGTLTTFSSTGAALTVSNLVAACTSGGLNSSTDVAIGFR